MTRQPAEQTQSSRRRRFRSAALPAAVVVAVGVAGCGGGSPSASSSAGCSPSGCSSPGASAALEAKAVKFSVCMRTHGATDFPDPTIGSNGLPSWTLSSRIGNAPAFSTARRVCKSDLPDLGGTPAERATAHANALKYAACMRSNGVPSFPDPDAQGVIQINSGPGGINTSSPQFQKAANTCQSLDNGFGQASSSAVSSSSSSGGNGS